MEGPPDLAIPTVLSFLGTRDICRCACIAKEWASCAQERLIEMKAEAARARAQMSDEERGSIDKCFLQAAKENKLEDIKALISKGANVDALNSYSSTALIWAIHNGHLAVIEVLLSHGADIHATDSDGYTGLMWAAQMGNLEIVEVLITHGADVDTTSSSSWTALMCAVFWDRTDVVAALVTAGASLDIINSDGKSALDLAQEDYPIFEVVKCPSIIEILTLAGD